MKLVTTRLRNKPPDSSFRHVTKIVTEGQDELSDIDFDKLVNIRS